VAIQPDGKIVAAGGAAISLYYGADNNVIRGNLVTNTAVPACSPFGLRTT